jgi:hypothetical protein
MDSCGQGISAVDQRPQTPLRIAERATHSRLPNTSAQASAECCSPILGRQPGGLGVGSSNLPVPTNEINELNAERMRQASVFGPYLAQEVPPSILGGISIPGQRLWRFWLLLPDPRGRLGSAPRFSRIHELSQHFNALDGGSMGKCIAFSTPLGVHWLQ